MTGIPGGHFGNQCATMNDSSYEYWKKSDFIKEIESLREKVSRLEKNESLRKVLEESWRSQNRFLQNIMESPTGISIISTDLEGNVLFWNKGAENLLGYQSEEMVGKQKIGVVYPDDPENKQKIMEVFKYILSEKKGTTCEIQELAKDGRRVWVKLTLSPRFDDRNRVIGIVGIGENCTERRYAEQKLAERIRLGSLSAEIGSILAGGDSLPPISRQCLKAIIQYGNAVFARIWTLHTGDHLLELQGHGQADEIFISDSMINRDRDLVEQTVKNRVPLVSNDIQNDSHFEEREWLIKEKVRAYASYPLIVEGRLMGILDLYSREEISPALEHALSGVSSEIALGIERIWAYATVSASEERIRSIVVNALDGIITTFQNGSIESINPAAESIFGFKAFEVLGKRINLLMPEPHYHMDHKGLQSLLETHRKNILGKVIEVVGRRKDGSVFPMELSVSELKMPERRRQPRATKDTRPLLYLGIVRDITERKRIETALREERDYSAKIIEKTPSLICRLSPEGAINFANPAVLHSTGYTWEQLADANWWKLFFPGDHYGQVDQLLKKIEQGPVVDYEMIMTTCFKELCTISWNFSYRRDDTGKVAEIIGFGIDITERNKVEAELKLAAQKAEESNRLKTNFISTISHEFRTPLNVVLGNTPLLTDEKELPPPSDINDIARDIEGSSKHLLDLIEDLLDFSKIEVGKMALNIEPLNIKSLVQDVVSNIQVIAQNKGLKLETECQDLELKADPVRLKQILLNLLSNAIKFTDTGTVRVIVKKTGETVMFQVVDTGCGIPEEHLARIFDVFHQVDSSFTRGASGTGLGLAITKKLVEMHGGSIWAESEGGKGTILYFTLPLNQKKSSP